MAFLWWWRHEKRWAAHLLVSVLQPGELIIYYELEESEMSSSRGIVEVCPDTHRWEQGLRSFSPIRRQHQETLLCATCSNFIDLFLSIRITRFLEKPQEGVTESRLASVVFYCIRKDTLSHLSDFLHLQPEAADRSFGRFWVCKCLITKCYFISFSYISCKIDLRDLLQPFAQSLDSLLYSGEKIISAHCPPVISC